MDRKSVNVLVNCKHNGEFIKAGTIIEVSKGVAEIMLKQGLAKEVDAGSCDHTSKECKCLIPVEKEVTPVQPEKDKQQSKGKGKKK